MIEEADALPTPSGVDTAVLVRLGAWHELTVDLLLSLLTCPHVSNLVHALQA